MDYKDLLTLILDFDTKNQESNKEKYFKKLDRHYWSIDWQSLLIYYLLKEKKLGSIMLQEYFFEKIISLLNLFAEGISKSNQKQKINLTKKKKHHIF